jgi:hypothetical protein
MNSAPHLDYISSNGSQRQQWITAAAIDNSSSCGSMKSLSGSHDVERALDTLLDFFRYRGFIDEAMTVFRLKEKFITSAQQ